MVRGMCALCKTRKGCKLRQPGTWVVRCNAFEEDPQAVSADLEPAPQPGTKERSGGPPSGAVAYGLNE